MVFGGLQVAEIKQFDDELAIVVLLELRQLLDAVFGIILLFGDVIIHAHVVDDSRVVDF